MRGDLEDAICRGINDGRTGADVLITEFGDDFGAGSGLVAEGAATDAVLEGLHEGRVKALRIEGERFVEMDADHLPMPGGRVFTGGS